MVSKLTLDLVGGVLTDRTGVLDRDRRTGREMEKKSDERGGSDEIRETEQIEIVNDG